MVFYNKKSYTYCDCKQAFVQTRTLFWNFKANILQAERWYDILKTAVHIYIFNDIGKDAWIINVKFPITYCICKQTCRQKNGIWSSRLNLGLRNSGGNSTIFRSLFWLNLGLRDLVVQQVAHVRDV